MHDGSKCKNNSKIAVDEGVMAMVAEVRRRMPKTKVQ